MSSSDRIAPLDGLRGLAILGIIIFHVATVIKFQWSPIWSSIFYIGRQGIVLFFIISGYSSRSFSLPHYFKKSSSNTIAKYLISRFFRISPLYYLVIFASIIILKFWFPLGITSIKEINLINILVHITYLHSLFPEYFLSIVSVAWVLGLEMYFYLSSIILYSINNHKTHLLFFFLSAVISVLSPIFIPNLWPGLFRGGTVVWLENSPLVYFVFYYTGYFLAETELIQFIKNRFHHPYLGDAVFAISAISFIALIISHHLIIANFLIIPLFFSIFLPAKIINKLFSSIFFTTNGNLSYALFLVHTIVFSGYLNYLRPFESNLPVSIFFPLFLIIVYISSLSIAFFLHRFVEIPGNSLGKKIVSLL